MTINDFATRLTALRERAGLSQYRLAQLTGVSRQAVSQLENGDSVPTWPTVQLIALALGLNCSVFVDPTLQLPEEKPTAPRGRPKKPAGAPAKKRKKK
jgi:transcriptional regulator with XRE-family HTH domain